MPQKSSITKLDPRIRAAVDEQIQSGRYTTDSLLEAIQALGGAASRSAVGRYAKNAEAQMARYREAQEVAKTWIGKLNADPEGDVGRLLTEMLRMLAFEQVDKLSGSSAANTMDVMLLAKAIKDLANTDKLTLERIDKIKEMARKEAAEAVDRIAKSQPQGMTKEVRAMLRAEILGINK